MVGNEIQETLVIENDEQARRRRSQCKYKYVPIQTNKPDVPGLKFSPYIKARF